MSATLCVLTSFSFLLGAGWGYFIGRVAERAAIAKATGDAS